MKSECLIIAGGIENQICSFYPDGFSNVFVIACDKGYDYAHKQNLPMDFVCGDFDSASSTIPSEKDFTCGVEVLPTHKDDTDLIYAIRYALKKGFSRITVTCAGGGRTDHFISNIQALVFAKGNAESEFPSEKSVIRLLDDDNEVLVIKNESVVLPKRDGSSLTVLSYTDKSVGVTITGAEYEVSDAVFTNRFPLGQSNSWKNEQVTVSVKEGILLLIMSKVEL